LLDADGQERVRARKIAAVAAPTTPTAARGAVSKGSARLDEAVAIASVFVTAGAYRRILTSLR
jgi:hypothetical protein